MILYDHNRQRTPKILIIVDIKKKNFHEFWWFLMIFIIVNDNNGEEKEGREEGVWKYMILKKNNVRAYVNYFFFVR